MPEAPHPLRTSLLGASLLLLLSSAPAISQQTAAAPPSDTAAAAATTTPEPLNDDELQKLVAPIALYPDQLVSLIASASLFPLQVIEAQRFLDDVKKDPTLKPKDSWDGSIISLLNYPDIVKMMSDDLDWTQSMQQAITYQQNDVLLAIQQLRDKAVADNMIKTDDKITVTEEDDNVVIQPTHADTIYIPEYPPEMLYEPGYAVAPIDYYPYAYDNYYYPDATYFAGFVTGAAWASIIDWNDGDIWGGRWDSNLNIDCNRCFNDSDFSGRLNMGDINWANVDRSKIDFDRSQLDRIDRSSIENSLKSREVNNLGTRASEVRAGGLANRERASQINDVRNGGGLGAAAAAGAAGAAAANLAGRRPEAAANRAANAGNRAATAGNRAGTAGNRASSANKAAVKSKAASKASGNKAATRTSGKKKPGTVSNTRTRQPSAMGEVRSGKKAQVQSTRGRQSMGGGQRRSATPQRSRPSGGGRGGGGRGGGGRGGGGRR